MNKTAETLGAIFGGILVTYFVFYPIVYFTYNWFIQEIGYVQYKIPGFWVGMAGLFLFNIVKNFLFARK